MARLIVTFDDLVAIAKRTGVDNWRGDNGSGRVIAAPSSWRGKRGEMGTVCGVTRHHTGTSEDYKPTEDYPTYQVVKEGRPGLENSLSAFGLGRHFGIYVFSEDLSWHAGVWEYAGITDGNGHFLGIEAEGTGAVWTPFQREFYPRLTASILLFIDEGADMMPRHADGAMPRGRKDDARNLPADFADKVAGYLSDPSTLTYGGTNEEEDDMTPQDRAVLNAIAARAGHVEQMVGDVAGRQVAQIRTDAALAGQVAGLAEAVSQLGSGGGVDMAAITAAATEAAERTVAELGEKLARPDGIV